MELRLLGDETPVIGISAHNRFKMTRISRDVGMHAIFEKPFNKNIFFDFIDLV